MRDDQRFYDLLCCLACQGQLRLEPSKDMAADGHIISGTLRCSACAERYPIVGGIPRFVPTTVSTEVSNTIDGFGYQWQHANPLIQNQRFTAAETFLDFIHPVQPEDFKDKIVLDAGCGAGASPTGRSSLAPRLWSALI